MKVIKSNNAGFCPGVRRAVRRARDVTRASGRNVYTDGALVHNPQLLKKLEAEGIHETDDPSTLTEGALLIRAHGITPERRRWLKELPVDLVDATCPDVARIHSTVRKHVRKGFDIIVLGDDCHPEVAGIMGYTEGHGYRVSGPDQVADLPELGAVCLVAQSTQTPERFESVARAVLARFPDAVVVDTICGATRCRRGELEQLAAEAEMIVVVGGRNSANTRRLLEMAKELGPAIQVESADELQAADYKERSIVGVTAGASTPDYLIDEVCERLKTF